MWATLGIEENRMYFKAIIRVFKRNPPNQANSINGGLSREGYGDLVSASLVYSDYSACLKIQFAGTTAFHGRFPSPLLTSP